MYRTFAFYILDSQKYRKLKYPDKVSDIESWITENKIQVIEELTDKRNKYKLIYFLNIPNNNYGQVLKQFYELPSKFPFVYKVIDY